MFVIICKNCGKEILIDKDVLSNMGAGNEDIDIIAVDKDLIINCYECLNYISTRD